MNERYDSLGIVDALRAFFGGVGFIIATPRVWGWAMVPAALMLALMLGITCAGTWGSAELLALLFGEERGTWGDIGYYTSLVLTILAVLLLAVVGGLTLTQPLAGFALERVASAQEFALTGKSPPHPSFWASFWLSLKTVAFSLALGGTAIVALFLMEFFVPPAAVITVPLKFLVCAWMLAWDFLDYPLGLKGMHLGERLRWVMRHFGAFTVFGACWASLAIVPGIVLCLLPMGVSGATRMLIVAERKKEKGTGDRSP